MSHTGLRQELCRRASKREEADYSFLATEGKNGVTVQVYLVKPGKQEDTDGASSALLKYINMQPLL